MSLHHNNILINIFSIVNILFIVINIQKIIFLIYIFCIKQCHPCRLTIVTLPSDNFNFSSLRKIVRSL